MLDSLSDSFENTLGVIVGFLPNLLAAIVLLVLGWLLGKLAGSVVTKLLRTVRFNEVADRAEIDTFIQKAGVRSDPSELVGTIVKWTIYLVFFLAAFAALGLPQVSVLINSVVAYLPKVVLAVVVLLVAALIGKVLAGMVRGTVGSFGIGNAGLYANVARFAVIGFAVIAALDILDIAPTVVSALWIAFLALMVGSVVLAFGFGGREAASDLMLGRMLRSEIEPGVEITAGVHTGKVVSIGSLFMTLETPSGIVKVPNGHVTGQALHMEQSQYQWQVRKREELRERAKAAAKSASENGNRPSNSDEDRQRVGSRKSAA